MTFTRRNCSDYPMIPNWLEDIFAKDYDAVSRFKGTIPLVNIRETNESFVIELAAPGFVKEDFDIDLDNNILTISTIKKQETEKVTKNYTKKEFDYTEFKRSFTLPETADFEKIDAKYEKGILEITITKKDEAKVQPKRKIDIG